MQIREIDPANASYAQASEICNLISYAFQNDDFFKVLLGPRYFMPLPPPVGSAWHYRKLHFTDTLKMWARLKSNDTRNFELLNDNNEIIGFSSWGVPRSLKVETPRWRRVSIWLIKKLLAVVNTVLFFGEGDLSPPTRWNKARVMFDEIDKDLGWLNVKDEDLAHLDLDSLTKTLYHQETMWWCFSMAIHPNYHRQGYGKALFSRCLEELKPFYPTFKDGEAEISGPAKYGLFASPQGRGLYESMGFVKTRDIVKELEGTKIELPLYVKTVF
ncbi:hypothetical protein B9G98_00807 [Wickerhamiella sorbophila]|uniref:N-acetyltransferase domain-containing protein n=1 Tax=Wickerhamiella sorbophila TaxID=45607 RepID=A0A2T0FDZ9_9ASCO|nr:hypothetical protein B9G98_00807 [Wickerhamiella sorbophila]PRT53187.1 hypothetical protein B9G98_00807 [Wickerhamiella sorbophila]